MMAWGVDGPRMFCEGQVEMCRGKPGVYVARSWCCKSIAAFFLVKSSDAVLMVWL